MSTQSRVDAAWQKVTCKDCGRSFQCTPYDDYYGNTTLEDGQCENCLLREHGMEDAKRAYVLPPSVGGSLS